MAFPLRVALLLALLAITYRADACSCAKRLSVAEQVRSSHLIFVGEVQRVEDRLTLARRFWLGLLELFGRQPTPASHDYERNYGYRVSFRAITTWQGPPKRTVTLFTGRGDGDCGYAFEPGRTYLVYAYCDGHCSTGICTRTSEAARAREDLAFLAKLPTVRLPPK